MEKDMMKKIGAKIAEIRRLHNVTQEGLADMLGVTPKHISHCENATSCFSLKNLIQFCIMFECSLDYVVFGNNNNQTLSKLPDEIVTLLNTGSTEDLDRLNRYLQIFIELNHMEQK